MLTSICRGIVISKEARFNSKTLKRTQQHEYFACASVDLVVVCWVGGGELGQERISHTFSGSCKAIHILVATWRFCGREWLDTEGMHFMAFKQASLTWTSFTYIPERACKHQSINKELKKWNKMLKIDIRQKNKLTVATSSACRPKHSSFNMGPTDAW